MDPVSSSVNPAAQSENIPGSVPVADMENVEVRYTSEPIDPVPSALGDDVQSEFPVSSLMESQTEDAQIPTGIPDTVPTTTVGSMVGWARSAGTPLDEPSEEFIKESCKRLFPGIEADDLEMSAHVRHYLLTGRDYWSGAFPRFSSLLGYCMSPHPTLRIMKDPASTCKEVEDRKANRGPDGLCRAPNFAELKYHSITPWEERVPVSSPPLLGISLACCTRVAWGKEFKFTGIPSFLPGYIEWAQHVLIHENAALEASGIYDGIFLSLFRYGTCPQYARAFFENFSPATSTCYTVEGEIGITLLDAKDCFGLPITDEVYDECIPPDTYLFGRLENGRPFIPPCYIDLLQIYLQLGHRGVHSAVHRSVTFDKWISYFCKLDSDRERGFLNVENPFGRAGRPVYELRGQP